MIEYQDRVVFYHQMEKELAVKTVETVRRYGFRPILEGRTYIYMDQKDFQNDYYGKKLNAELGERLIGITEHWGEWEISKLSCATDSPDREACFQALSLDFDFMIHNPFVARGGAQRIPQRNRDPENLRNAWDFSGRYLCIWRQCQRSWHV